VDALGLEHVTGIGETSLNILGTQMIVFPQDSFLSPAPAKQIDNKLDRNSSSLQNGFPDQDIRINGDPVPPIHGSPSFRVNQHRANRMHANHQVLQITACSFTAESMISYPFEFIQG
jgi:hypothetical protein